MIAIYATTANLPGVTMEEALEQITGPGVYEPLLGRLSASQVQLCPQTRGAHSIERARRLRGAYPGVSMRLHANVRVQSGQPRYRASDVHSRAKDYFVELGRVSKALEASVYTLHAPRRDRGSLASLAGDLASIEEWMGVDVGVEGMCAPTDLLSSWAELRWLLDSGLKYALDLSHVQIIARRERSCDEPLVRDLLLAPGCVEVHVSDNDGRRDQHGILLGPPWWWTILEEAGAEDGPVVFSEGNQLRRRPTTET